MTFDQIAANAVVIAGFWWWLKTIYSMVRWCFKKPELEWGEFIGESDAEFKLVPPQKEIGSSSILYLNSDDQLVTVDYSGVRCEVHFMSVDVRGDDLLIRLRKL